MVAAGWLYPVCRAVHGITWLSGKLSLVSLPALAAWIWLILGAVLALSASSLSQAVSAKTWKLTQLQLLLPMNLNFWLSLWLWYLRINILSESTVQSSCRILYYTYHRHGWEGWTGPACQACRASREVRQPFTNIRYLNEMGRIREPKLNSVPFSGTMTWPPLWSLSLRQAWSSPTRKGTSCPLHTR